LKAVFLAEAFLHRVKAIAIGESLNGSDLRTIGLHRKNSARLHCPAVQMNRAGAALAGIATDMRPG
jgi:hypothetical protein